MSYAKTVLISCVICFVTLGTGATTIILLLTAHAQATGLALVTRGFVELLIASLIFGWIGGSAWYIVRR
jgi:hypothetical protein